MDCERDQKAKYDEETGLNEHNGFKFSSQHLKVGSFQPGEATAS